MVFAEVARQQSFTDAAKQLKMSKSAASQHVSKLESEIGYQLLSRNTRGMVLTAAGSRLLERSELLKDQVDLALLEITEEEQSPSGLFSITCPHSFETDIALPAIKQLCIEFPNIEPKIIVTDDPLDLISEGLDAAIYAGNLRDSGYRALPIGSLTEKFCATPSYLQKHGTPDSLTKLKDHRWIATHWQKSPLSVYSISQPEKPETIKLTPYGQSNSFSCVLDMAKEDMGVAFFPEMIRQPLIEKGIMVPILDEFRGAKWSIYFVHPYQRKKPLHVERFYQLSKYFFIKTTASA